LIGTICHLPALASVTLERFSLRAERPAFKGCPSLKSLYFLECDLANDFLFLDKEPCYQLKEFAFDGCSETATTAAFLRHHRSTLKRFKLVNLDAEFSLQHLQQCHALKYITLQVYQEIKSPSSLSLFTWPRLREWITEDGFLLIQDACACPDLRKVVGKCSPLHMSFSHALRILHLQDHAFRDTTFSLLAENVHLRELALGFYCDHDSPDPNGTLSNLFSLQKLDHLALEADTQTTLSGAPRSSGWTGRWTCSFRLFANLTRLSLNDVEMPVLTSLPESLTALNLREGCPWPWHFDWIDWHHGHNARLHTFELHVEPSFRGGYNHFGSTFCTSANATALVYISRQEALAFAREYPHLRSLHFRLVKLPTLSNVAICFPSLTSMTLELRKLTVLPVLPPSLQKLELITCRRLNNMDGVQSCRALTSCQIQWCDRVEDLTPLVACTQLESFSWFRENAGDLSPLDSLLHLREITVNFATPREGRLHNRHIHLVF
jgi:hypothetical protein